MYVLVNMALAWIVFMCAVNPVEVQMNFVIVILAVSQWTYLLPFTHPCPRAHCLIICLWLWVKALHECSPCVEESRASGPEYRDRMQGWRKRSLLFSKNKYEWPEQNRIQKKTENMKQNWNKRDKTRESIQQRLDRKSKLRHFAGLTRLIQDRCESWGKTMMAG